MMERGFSQLQRAENSLVLAYAPERPALQQNIGLIIGRLIVIAAMLVASGKHSHAAADIIRHSQRQPHGYLVVMAQSPICQVLMPADMARGARLLDDIGNVVEQDVRSDHGLDYIERCRVPRQLQR